MCTSHYLPLFLSLLFWGRVDSLFQVSCSGYDSNGNRYYLPYFGGRERTLNANERENSQTGVTYIYPVAGTRINCSGTLSEVEFCYTVSSSSHYGSNQVVFQLDLLSINGRYASLLSTTTVSSVPNADKCMGTYCCDVMALDSGIMVGSSTGTLGIGISIPSSNAMLQAFHASSTDYSVMAYLQTVQPTGQFELPLSTIQQPLQIVWFHIEPDMSVTSTVQMITPATSMPSSLPISQTSASLPDISQTSTVQMVTPETSMPSSLPVPQTSTSLPTQQTTSSPFMPEMIATPLTPLMTPPTSPMTPFTSQITTTDIISFTGNNANSVIGGVVSGVLSLLALLISCIVAALIIITLQKRRKCTLNIPKGNAAGNAIYLYSKDKNTALSNPGYGDASKFGKKVICKDDGDSNENEYDYPQVNFDAENRKRNMEPSPYECPQVRTVAVNSHSSKADLTPVEEIYVVPPKDVTQLYAQLEEVRADKLTRDNVKLKGLLGSGEFGEVYQGVWNCLDGDLEVAVKTLKENSSEQDRVKFLQEAAIMGQFTHANVVTMYGVISEEEPVLLVLEILKKGDLKKHLHSMRINGGNEILPELDNLSLLTYCRQVASGMEYLSSKAFVHRDLAARNILVSENSICKITDFGMSRDLMDETYYVSKSGKIPVKWTAPEALHYKKYSTASDVWSYGVVMYEIWSVGHKPFEEVSNYKVIRIVDSGYRLPPPPGCPRAIYSIMISCWAPNTGERPTFSEVHNQLSTSNSELLHWSDESKVADSNATTIGAELAHGNSLHMDLQVKYKNNQ